MGGYIDNDEVTISAMNRLAEERESGRRYAEAIATYLAADQEYLHLWLLVRGLAVTKKSLHELLRRDRKSVV